MLIKSQSEVRLHTVRSVHFHPADVPDPPFRFFKGLVPRLDRYQRSAIWSHRPWTTPSIARTIGGDFEI